MGNAETEQGRARLTRYWIQASGWGAGREGEGEERTKTTHQTRDAKPNANTNLDTKKKEKRDKGTGHTISNKFPLRNYITLDTLRVEVRKGRAYTKVGSRMEELGGAAKAKG